MTPLELLPGLKTGLELAKNLRDAVKKPETQPDEVAARLLEIIDQITESKIQASELVDEHLKLKRERDNALEQLAVAKDMEFVLDGQFYVRKSEASNGLIPYCPTCWKVEGRTVHLKLSPSGEYYSCTIHQNWKYQTEAQIAIAKERIAKASSGPMVKSWNWWDR